jgi:hypothetical protein
VAIPRLRQKPSAPASKGTPESANSA